MHSFSLKKKKCIIIIFFYKGWIVAEVKEPIAFYDGSDSRNLGAIIPAVLGCLLRALKSSISFSSLC